MVEAALAYVWKRTIVCPGIDTRSFVALDQLVE